MTKIKFGKHVQTETIDDMGSTKTVETTYHEGVGKVRNYYEVRTKVKDDKEELAETIRFMKEQNGKNRSTRVEVPNKPMGFYYLIKCWED